MRGDKPQPAFSETTTASFGARSSTKRFKPSSEKGLAGLAGISWQAEEQAEEQVFASSGTGKSMEKSSMEELQKRIHFNINPFLNLFGVPKNSLIQTHRY